MKVERSYVRLNSTHYFLFLIALMIAAGFVGDKTVSASKPSSTVTWDGGGITNNWGEAANWSGNVIPGASDDVIFDATSTKDTTIDVSVAVGSIKIDTGYTGTVTQSDAASIAVSGCSGRPCFQQNNGTFNGSSNTIAFNNLGSGGLLMNGGIFNGGSGDISLTGNPADLSLQGGTFKSTSGNLTTSGTLRFQGTSVFQPGNGTVTVSPINSFSSMATDANHTSVTFNNLVFNNADGANFDIGQRVVVAGNLFLNNGTVGQNGSTIEARGGVSISPNFDGGVVSLELANGNGPRTFTFETSLHLPKLVINDPNVTVNTSGSGAVTFPHQLILSAGVFNQGNDLIINAVGIGGGFCYVQNGGTFNGSSNTITLNSDGFGSIRLTGGTFNGGSGDINLVGAPADNASIILQGGTFRSTSGNLTVPGQFGFQGAGTVFLHNSGTVTLNPGQNQFFTADSNHPTINFNDLNLSPSNGVNYDFGIRAIIEGTLSLNEGSIGQNGSTIEARGDVSISPNFDGGFAALEFANGSGPRTFTFTPDLKPPKIVINDAAVTLNTSGPGTVRFPQGVILSQGTFNQNDADLVIDPPVGGGFCYLQTGGTFNGSANTIAANSNGFGSIRLTGGSFNGGSGDINLVGAPADNASIILQGGTFRSTSGNLTVPGQFGFQGVGTVFLPNNGTVNFTAGQNNFVTNDSLHLTMTFNNVNISLANGVNLGLGPVMIILGNLNLNDGSVGQAGTSVEPHGPVTVGPNFDGGPTNFTFGGTANQTFTNNGGVNPTGTWIVNKPSGIVTAATSLILQPTQQLNITSGTLFLGNGSDLTAGPITIGATGKLVADSSQTITLGGNLSNSGVVDLQGGGAGCPESDTILVLSSTPGTQRNWTGGGAFRLVDVDIQDQAGTAPVTIFNGTNGGNNGANFAFNSTCPTALSISPLTTSAVTGSSFQFIAGGGIGTRTFSFAVNNSGGSIVAGNGQYTAGPTPDVTDTIRVTDSLGSFTDATVNVTGPGSKLKFIQQPTDAAAGSSISPPIQVAIQDQAGVTVTTATNTIVITISNNPGGGTLTGTASKAAVGGVATFNNLSINQIANGYTLRAGANSLTAAISSSFNITAGEPASLQFITQPQDVIAGAAITQAVQVAIKDGLGNIVTTANNPVTISIGNNPGGSTLSGTVTRAAVNGIATFSDLSLNNPGSGYTLSASSPTLSGATSDMFNVINPFQVTNAGDSGAGSLREAINNANATPGTQTISFNIPGPFLTIEVTSNLPTITDSVIIDGTTQPGYAGVPLVELNGWRIFTGNSIGLRFTAGGNTLKGLAVNGFQSGPNSGIGLSFEGPGSNTIEGNHIGVRVGPLNLPDANVRGILFSSPNNRVTGNVIADDKFGIVLDGLSSQNIIAGNLIGTDQNGNGIQSHVMNIGVFVDGTGNLIGGPNAGDRNVISGATSFGLQLTRDGNTVQGNYIGTTASGSAAFGNGIGVNLQSAKNNIILGNVISGNSQSGIRLQGLNVAGLDSSDNVIENNLIGLDATGNATLANLENGMLIEGGSSFNQRNRITANRIFGNGLLGIKLGSRTVANGGPPLPNDPQDPDTGANGLQNYPVLTAVLGGQVNGTINSTPSQNFTIELFSSPSCDAAGNGEGETFLRSFNISTGPSGIANFVVVLPTTVPGGRFVTATATDPGGNTSEFSKCSQVVARHSISGRITRSGQPVADAIVAVTGPGINNSTLTNSSGDYSFTNLPEGQAYIVTPRKSGLSFTPPQAGDNNLVTDRTIDFTAVQDRFAISGRVTANVVVSLRANAVVRRMAGDTVVQAAAPSGPFGLATVRMSLTGPTPAAFSTDFSGNYDLSGLLPGDYTLTPSKANYTFTPPSVSFTITSQNVRADFTADSPGLDLLPGRITFDTLGSIKAMNANGSGLVTVVSVNRFTSFSEPRVTPDGLKVTGVSNLPANIFTANSDGTGRLNVRRASGLHSPAWSPNGSKLAFFDSVSQTLKTMNANGSGVTSVAGNCTNPDWAADNTNIVCIRDRSLVTTQTGNLFNSSFNLSSPKFSPDGSKIALINGGAIEVMNSSGTGRTTIIPRDTFGSIFYLGLAWSPDGTRLAFVKRICGGNGQCVKQLIAIFPTTDTSQQGQLTIDDDFAGTNIDWSLSPGVSTPTGSNVTVGTGGANITFPSVGNAGSTNIVPISPASAGLLPNGFVVGSQAFDISTTANFTPLITVCFTMPSNTTLVQFNQTFLLHNENGVLVNRTSNRNFAAKQVCGQVASLSPFALAEQVDPSLPSIKGLVLDANGDPLCEVPVFLSGTEDKTTTTDVNGEFEFANLTAGGNYNVQPKQPGVIFSEYSQDLLGLTGENTVVFTGTPVAFSIGGKVADQNGVGISGASVLINGSVTDTVLSDSNGNYLFTDLPADGIYSVSASNGVNVFSPAEQNASPLISDVSGLDFTALIPTAAHVPISGQVVSQTGSGISGAIVSLMDARGQVRAVRTNTFGYFTFDSVLSGEAYLLNVSSRRYRFEPRLLSVDNSIADLKIVGVPF